MPSILLCRRLILILGCALPLFASATPSLTPADFAVDSTFVDTELSPNGELLAVTIVHEGKRQLAVFTTKDKKVVGGARFPGRQEAGQAYWVNNERLVIKILKSDPWDEQPKFYGQLYAVDYNGKNGELIYGVGAGEMQTGSKLRKKQDTYGWGELVSILPDDPKHILISSTPMSDGGERRATIHKLNVYDGKLSRQLTRSPVSYARFITDGKGNLKIAFGLDAKGDRRTYRYDNDQWLEISAEFGPGFYPLALNEAGDKLYYLDDPEKDLKGLFELDMLSGTKREIYTDDQVDLTSVTYSSDGNSIYALRVDPDYPTYVMLNSTDPEADLYRQFLHSFPGYKIAITSRSDDGRWWLLYASNDIDAGTYYLYDKERHALQPMFSNLAHLKANYLSQSEPVSFLTSDQVKISGYLTYPQSAPAEHKVPLVVLVHGGPHGVRDYWAFDRKVQLLASQGYAVLRVNFRGSDGYGRTFREAGHRQWGGLMMRDIVEGTRWAASLERIDASKICIVGSSFGGYAAMQAAIVDPDLYRCVVGTVGVYDLPLMFEKGDIPERLYGDSYLTDVLGKDEAQLRAFSPVYNAGKLKAAIMIAHNKKDRRVPIEHAERLRDALEKEGKSYEWFIKDTEAHGFSDADNRADYYQAVSQYLSKHLAR